MTYFRGRGSEIWDRENAGGRNWSRIAWHTSWTKYKPRILESDTPVFLSSGYIVVYCIVSDCRNQDYITPKHSPKKWGFYDLKGVFPLILGTFQCILGFYKRNGFNLEVWSWKIPQIRPCITHPKLFFTSIQEKNMLVFIDPLRRSWSISSSSGRTWDELSVSREKSLRSPKPELLHVLPAASVSGRHYCRTGNAPGNACSGLTWNSDEAAVQPFHLRCLSSLVSLHEEQ